LKIRPAPVPIRRLAFGFLHVGQTLIGAADMD
jgi:hypothetical protein